LCFNITGKLGISNKILEKPGKLDDKLDDSEFEIIKIYSKYSYEILKI
jgi:HD-GYP domain-containing protein (c-di-GMP phosphodiesterase class II)